MTCFLPVQKICVGAENVIDLFEDSVVFHLFWVPRYLSSDPAQSQSGSSWDLIIRKITGVRASGVYPTCAPTPSVYMSESLSTTRFIVLKWEGKVLYTQYKCVNLINCNNPGVSGIPRSTVQSSAVILGLQCESIRITWDL